MQRLRKLFDDLKLPHVTVQLGEVTLERSLTESQTRVLKSGLIKLGFELLDDIKTRFIEKIKTIIIEDVHYGKGDDRLNFSALLSSELHKDYSYLSNVFSATEGITIERYIINQKIEKVKELIVYDELSLTEIAYQLGYSSVAHLSTQFKKVTGLTPSHFKKMPGNKRRTLDAL